MAEPNGTIEVRADLDRTTRDVTAYGIGLTVGAGGMPLALGLPLLLDGDVGIAGVLLAAAGCAAVVGLVVVVRDLWGTSALLESHGDVVYRFRADGELEAWQDGALAVRIPRNEVAGARLSEAFTAVDFWTYSGIDGYPRLLVTRTDGSVVAFPPLLVFGRRARGDVNERLADAVNRAS